MNDLEGDRCGHARAGTPVFQFPAGDHQVLKCWACALRYPPMLGRSMKIAAVVGTILAAINHGDRLVTGEWSAGDLLKILLTYGVPFGVATYSALMNSRAAGSESRPADDE